LEYPQRPEKPSFPKEKTSKEFKKYANELDIYESDFLIYKEKLEWIWVSFIIFTRIS
jgi:hypothetical protein